MSIKSKLIAVYEKLYCTEFVMNSIYRCNNKNHRLNILSSEDTIERVLASNCSVTRFGEGEFELILHSDMDLGFQKRNPQLAKRLTQVLSNRNEQLMICIPYALNDIKGRTEHSRKFWFYWGRNKEQHHNIVSLIRKLQDNSYIFGDTQITRPYIAYSSPEHGAKMFPLLKQLWNDKDILFVEGAQTRLGVGNDLFDNARSIRRVLCHTTNAFDHYDEIVEAVKHVYQGELILLALGPTATVLASDFADMGMRAIDLGHLDIEYEWYLSGATEHTQVSGKFTNEADGGHDVSDCEDAEYAKQIVWRVGC